MSSFAVLMYHGLHDGPEELARIPGEERPYAVSACFEESASCPYDVVGEALWKLTSDRAIDTWIAGLTNGSWWYPRAACATALGRVKAGRGIEPLVEVLGDSEPRVRREAVLALMDIGSEKALGGLEEATQDIDFEVRIYAKEAVRRIKADK